MIHLRIEKNKAIIGIQKAVRDINKAREALIRGDKEDAINYAWMAMENALNSIKLLINGTITTRHATFRKLALRFHYREKILSKDFSSIVDDLERYRLWAQHGPYAPVEETDFNYVKKLVEKVEKLVKEVEEYISKRFSLGT